MAKQKPSDEQLGQLAVKHAEHFRRVKEGTLPAKPHIKSVQALCEGRTVSVPKQVIELRGDDPNFPPLEDSDSKVAWWSVESLAKGKRVRVNSSIFKTMLRFPMKRDRDYRLALINPFEINQEFDWEYTDLVLYAMENGLSFGPYEILPRLVSRLLHGDPVKEVCCIYVMHIPLPVTNETHDHGYTDPNGYPLIHSVMMEDDGGITVSSLRFGHVVMHYGRIAGHFAFCC